MTKANVWQIFTMLDLNHVLKLVGVIESESIVRKKINVYLEHEEQLHILNIEIVKAKYEILTLVTLQNLLQQNIYK